MTISVPVAQTLEGTNIVDTTPTYDRNARAYYQTSQNMQELNSIYSYSGVSFVPDLYDVANEQSYVVHQVLFKDNTTVKVTAVGALTVLRQPEEYAAVADTTFAFDTWTKPFSKIQTAIPAGTYSGFTKVVDGVTHQLFRDSSSSTGWRHKITRSETVFYWADEEYNGPQPYTWVGWGQPEYDAILSVEYKGTLKFQQYNHPKPTAYVSIWTGNDGIRYRCGYQRVEGAYCEWNIQQERSRVDTYTYNTEANVYTSLDNNSVMLNAYCQDGVDCADRWLGRTFVLRGSDLYVRTNSGAIETKVVNTPQYAVIYELKDFPYFTLIGATDKYKPFDNKNYTFVISNSGTMIYIVKVDEAFDTIALGNVKAETITLVFYDELDNVVASASGNIDTSRDTIGNLEPWYTTLIFYSSPTGKVKDAIKINAGGKISVTLTSTKEIVLSTLMPAISAQAGMTNMEINNEYKDFSTFGYDIFGNPDYTERARVARYSGNVDIPITDYAKTDRLMSSLGKRMVVVNGANMSSLAIGSQSIFASTQKIGRFMSFKQNTKVKDDDLDVMANYSYTLEEII